MDCLLICSIYLAALIESDAEGIGGSGFIECIREHINSVCVTSNNSTKILLVYLASSYCLLGMAMPFDRGTIYCCQGTCKQEFFFTLLEPFYFYNPKM